MPTIPTPQPVYRLHSGIQAPVRLTNVALAYPEIARQARVEGIVIVEVTIDNRGEVVSAHVLRSVTSLLDRAALDAVQQWRFSPARLNGEVIPVVMTVTVNFKLDR